jgi:hypothetical protein
MRIFLIIVGSLAVLIVAAIGYARRVLTVNDVMIAYAKDAVDAGAYLGEVLHKRHGGKWSKPADGLFRGNYFLTVHETQLSPPSKVYKRIVDGAEDNLNHYYQVAIQRQP